MSDTPHPTSSPASSSSTGESQAQKHHTQEWSSGTRGGGKVPEDFGWSTNPKQWQEELGSAGSGKPGGN